MQTNRLDFPSTLTLASRDIRHLTYKHLFIRRIVPTIGNLSYALIGPPAAKISDICAQDELSMIISPQEFYEWKAICKHSTYVQKIQFKYRSDRVRVNILFKDQSVLSLNLILSFRKKGIIIADAEQLLATAQTNKDGIKTVQAAYAFEYLYLSHCFDRFPITERIRIFFNNLNSEDRVEIAEYIRSKYALKVESLEKLLHSVAEFRQQVQHVLHQLPFNKGTAGLKHNWQYLLDLAGDHLGISSRLSLNM